MGSSVTSLKIRTVFEFEMRIIPSAQTSRLTKKRGLESISLVKRRSQFSKGQRCKIIEQYRPGQGIVGNPLNQHFAEKQNLLWFDEIINRFIFGNLDK